MAENYKVIARKYRPQTFEEVIGQEHITKTISKSIALLEPMVLEKLLLQEL